MPLRILIAPDKYKGTLTALEAADAIAAGWAQARPDDRLERLPISDGGDGFGAALGFHLHAQWQPVQTTDAAHRPLASGWWWEPRTRTAIIESAQTIGLALLPPGRYHPFDLDTRGLGAVFEAAAECGAVRCLIGIGGSATNDAGFGLARALGWEFLDAHGNPIDAWTRLPALASLRAPPRRRRFRDLCVAVDVRNPLRGRYGAARVYGPQKGLRKEDLPLADACFKRLTEVARRHGLPPVEREPGTGAAGGLGYGLRCFLGARLEPGFALFARRARLRGQLRQADLVLTGEGAIDPSTLMGKGVGELAHWCQERRIPCLGLAGCSPWPAGAARGGFTALFRLTPDLTSADDARRRAAHWLQAVSAQAARHWEVMLGAKRQRRPRARA